MWKPAKEISTGSSSVFDLKVELFKKKAEFERQRSAASASASSSASSVSASASASARPSKSKITIKNLGVEDRARKDAWMREKGAVLKDDPQSQKRLAIMREKADLYDRLSRGEFRNQRERNLIDSEDVMVDFDSKLYDTMPNEGDEIVIAPADMITITDEYGRERQVNKYEARSLMGLEVNLADDYKTYTEAETKGFHMFPPPNLDNTAEIKQRLHEADHELEDIVFATNKEKVERYDPERDMRNMGTAYYKFSRDEEERKKQILDLNDLHEHTSKQRSMIDDVKEQRRKRLEDRMSKIRRVVNKKSEEKSPETHQEVDEAQDFLDSIFTNRPS